jgi:alanine racemase
MKVASIPIGYSHGYSRSLSNQGRVLIKGQQCIVVGSVNMNMMTVDVTNLESVKKDDGTDWLSKRDFNINRFF